MRVPLVDLSPQHAEVRAELDDGWEALLASSDFVGGAAVQEFEEAYAAFVGAAHCVGLGNGTDALELALRAVGVTPDSEVVLPANTFVATAEAVVRIGARPVLVDVDETHLLIDPGAVARAAGDRMAAIVPVHLFGQVAPVEELEPVAARYGAAVVEDAAQAQGARRHGRAAGALGAAGSTSFYPGKNLGALGDAGAVTTDDDAVAHRVRLLGNHGSTVKYRHEAVGFNSRLDTLQAAVLLAKLPRLAGWNAARARAAARYAELLADVPGLTLPRSAPGNEDVWHLYPVRVPERDRVLTALQDAGIGAAVHYPLPVHLTEAFRHLGHARGDFPVAEAACDSLLSLPIYPHITAEAQEYVAAALRRALGAR